MAGGRSAVAVAVTDRSLNFLQAVIPAALQLASALRVLRLVTALLILVLLISRFRLRFLAMLQIVQRLPQQLLGRLKIAIPALFELRKPTRVLGLRGRVSGFAGAADFGQDRIGFLARGFDFYVAHSHCFNMSRLL